MKKLEELFELINFNGYPGETYILFREQDNFIFNFTKAKIKDNEIMAKVKIKSYTHR